MHTSLINEIQNSSLYLKIKPLLTVLTVLVHCLLAAELYAKSIDFFSYDVNDDNALVAFSYKAGDVDSLHYAALAFFSVDDCQEALLAYYKTPSDEPVSFPIKPKQRFDLLSDKTYHIASKLLAETEINSIQSILIRFRGPNQELPRFLGGCADQGINCCIAIQCSNDAGVCLPKYSIVPQPFILFSSYD
jgi:hypothetical protein